MSSVRVRQWEQISDDYQEGLLLGNGASTAIDDRFEYPSLLEECRSRGLMTPTSSRLFASFGTSDFERIMELLWTTRLINRALGISDKLTKRAYNWTRRSLILVVRAIHPDQADVIQHFPAIASFIRHFSIIASLNYDVLLYWAFLWANSDRPSIKFKDCFPERSFDYEWQRFKEPIGHERKSIPVFYPHGNLALATDVDGNEAKVVTGASGDYLLSRITSMWTRRNLLPLFVSEGVTQQKLAVIRRSTYLGRVFDSVLPSVGESLVIYGSSLREGDSHILHALLSGSVRRIALSVHRTGDGAWEERALLGRERIRQAAGNFGKRVRVDFFDAESDGAWIH